MTCGTCISLTLSDDMWLSKPAVEVENSGKLVSPERWVFSCFFDRLKIPYFAPAMVTVSAVLVIATRALQGEQPVVYATEIVTVQQSWLCMRSWEHVRMTVSHVHACVHGCVCVRACLP